MEEEIPVAESVKGKKPGALKMLKKSTMPRGSGKKKKKKRKRSRRAGRHDEAYDVKPEEDKKGPDRTCYANNSGKNQV